MNISLSETTVNVIKASLVDGIRLSKTEIAETNSPRIKTRLKIYIREAEIALKELNNQV